MKERTNPKSNFENILKRIAKMFFAQEFMHKEQLLVWIIADVIKLVGLCFVWSASARMTGSMDQGYVVTYYIMMILVGKLMQDITPENGVRQILSGKFSNSLLKPMSYLTEYLGSNIGSNIFRLIVSVPAFVLGVYITSKLGLWIADFNPYLVFVTIIAITLGFLINFLLGNIFTLLAFYNKNMEGMRTFYYNVTALFSGEFIPYLILPFVALFIVQVLPFRYTLSFPIEILLGRMTTYDMGFGFIIGVSWLIILYIIYSILFKKAIKKYAAEGV
jgi:ABC-2 type transport system permease protein